MSANPSERTEQEAAERGRSRTPGRGSAVNASAASSSTQSSSAPAGPRRVRLTLARIDPFSVMKLSFLISIAFGISLVVATALLWGVVDAMGVWDRMDKMLSDMNGGKPLPFMELFTFGKMVSYSIVVAVIDIVILTALGTLLAFLYNIVATLLGGLKVTFTDD